MQAYEFYTKPKDGMIQIPDQYKNQIKDNILVINTRKKADLLSPPSLKTKGWKFSREEANAR
jgi:hypothetical protein